MQDLQDFQELQDLQDLQNLQDVSINVSINITSRVLSGGLPSMWSSVLACYGNFFHGVSHSTALEVRTLECLAAADVKEYDRIKLEKP